MNEPELGIGIDPGMAFNPLPSSILDKTRQDSNPQALKHESSPLTTRPDLRPSKIECCNAPLVFYSVFHQLRQAKFAYGGLTLSSSRFSLLTQRPLKMTLTIRGIEIDSEKKSSLHPESILSNFVSLRFPIFAVKLECL
jgi:hypothetical protein